MRVIAGRGRSRSGQAPHGSPQRPVRRVPEACGGTHAAYASRPPHDVAIDRSRGGDPPREVVANAGMPPGGISPRRSRRSRRSRDRVLCLSPFRFVSLRSSFIVLAPDVGSSLFALRSSLFALRSSLFAANEPSPCSRATQASRASPSRPLPRFPASPLPRFPAFCRNAPRHAPPHARRTSPTVCRMRPFPPFHARSLDRAAMRKSASDAPQIDKTRPIWPSINRLAGAAPAARDAGHGAGPVHPRHSRPVRASL
ncbi:periplasmic ligand binding lipoprotein [Burkholderia pseudomallei]|nr:periplasmic ligand binding lipoprotein [Burkholderia pseudomallei]CAJ8782914.1 periplasmic ligand binding lipoprotein [Burkholderia pseudomallei]